MAYFRTCPYCKANLDPGEICDCRQKKEEEAKKVLTWKELEVLMDQKYLNDRLRQKKGA